MALKMKDDNLSDDKSSLQASVLVLLYTFNSVQLRPGAQNENNPQQRDWERGVWDVVFHSYYGNLTRDNVCG